jgi:UTP--glucose-1-phosphate uridylyltransferase
MINRITKAVIPAAGLGTRFLPITKSIPKEMIPILDTPSVDYIVREAVASGIKEILIIVSNKKESLIEYYKKNIGLETFLQKKDKHKQLKLIRDIGSGVKISFVYQKNQNGLGDAIRCARFFTKREPFIVMLGDDIMMHKAAQQPVAKQLINVFNNYKQSVVAVAQVEKSEVSKYGIIAPSQFLNSGKTLCSVKGMIEKPSIRLAPSNLAIVGRYIFTPEIYQSINKIKSGANGELQITDAIVNLLKTQKVYALNCKNQRYDIGSKEGLVKATIDFALNDDELHSSTLQHIHKILKK